ncbi:MAG: hypothetical protein HY326_10900 [Chloroflexi bacterium]|nr:hypothetical protein [Chloroflexota bacterium]
MQTTEFTIDVQNHQLICNLCIPDAGALAARPGLLLSFSSTRQASLGEDPYDLPAKIFTKAGHYVLTFALPHHGERVDKYGEGITGFCASLIDGVDPFKTFVADGIAAIDACLARGIDPGGRIYACGVSRSGYCAIRLAAADKRIKGVAGLAPVADWRRLKEFGAVRDRPEIAALMLENWVEQLAGRALYMAIGHRDDRVGTDACAHFALRFLAAEAAAGLSGGGLTFHVVESEGHGLGNEWRAAGANFLLDQCNRA